MNLVYLIRMGFKYSVIFLIFVSSIEICSRIDDSVRFNAPFWKTYTADRLRTIDKDGIQINVPNADFEKWRNNSLGFRGAEIPLSKPPGLIRIICLGASESYGLYESEGREWPAQLGAMLPHNMYQVINASVAGIGLESYKAYMMKYVLPIKPDIVICYINPFFFVPNYERINSNTVQRNRPVNKIGTEAFIDSNKSIMADVRFLPKLKQIVKGSTENSFPKLIEQYQIKKLQKQIKAGESKLLSGQMPKDDVSVACIKSYKNELINVVKFLEARGIKVLLCTYPSLMNLENLAATYPVMYYSARQYTADYSFNGMLDILSKMNKVTTSVAFENGTMFVDCEALVPKSLEYFADNVHYTDRGARQVASVIAEYIRHKNIEN